MGMQISAPGNHLILESPYLVAHRHLYVSCLALWYPPGVLNRLQ
jgi:hypothetical protein